MIPVPLPDCEDTFVMHSSKYVIFFDSRFQIPSLVLSLSRVTREERRDGMGRTYLHGQVREEVSKHAAVVFICFLALTFRICDNAGKMGIARGAAA